jgi:hypothetical protein
VREEFQILNFVLDGLLTGARRDEVWEFQLLD